MTEEKNYLHTGLTKFQLLDIIKRNPYKDLYALGKQYGSHPTYLLEAARELDKDGLIEVWPLLGFQGSFTTYQITERGLKLLKENNL